MKPKLSIVIPTYNRFILLKQTLQSICYENIEKIEIIVCDNCSTDDTGSVQEVFNNIKYYRHEATINGDDNILFALTQGTGDYIWILCDDDIPRPNSVNLIITAIDNFSNPGLINVDAIPSDKKISNYSSAAVETRWHVVSKNEFLRRIGDKLTFVSSAIIRRDLIDIQYLEKMKRLQLLAVGINLSAAKNNNNIIMPEIPLLYMRGGNSGGYDAFTVFSKNLTIALKSGQKFGFTKNSLTSVYRNALMGVMLYVISVWPKTIKGSINLFFYSFFYKEFYLYTLPAFIRSVYKNNLHNIISRFIKQNKNLGPDLSTLEKLQDHLDAKTNEVWYKSFFNGTPNGSVKYPCRIIGEKYIKISSNFHAGPSLRLEAWDSYGGEKYNPEVIIGSDVCFNSNVHIGAINFISIGNRVLVGSNVLITDHTHGQSSMADLSIPPLERKLFSKGPIVIEDDVLIGDNVCILPGVKIGKSSIIGAGAVVTKDVPPFSIAKGVPATSRLIEC